MNRPILRAGLIAAALASGPAGCHHADKVKTTDYTPKKADDPTAWNDKELDKTSSDSSSNPKASAALPQSSALKGTWSSDAQEIEKSLGVGR